MHDLRLWLLSFGAWTPVGYLATFLIATICCFPATPFTLIAGGLFGIGWGIAIALLASNLSANVAFWLARWTGIRWFYRWLPSEMSERMKSLLSHSGTEVVFTLRVLPLIPFVVFNYLAGLSTVRWADYAIGSLFGMIPATVIYVSLGSAVLEVHWNDPQSWKQPGVWAPLLLATLVILGLRAFRRWRG